MIEDEDYPLRGAELVADFARKELIIDPGSFIAGADMVEAFNAFHGHFPWSARGLSTPLRAALGPSIEHKQARWTSRTRRSLAAAVNEPSPDAGRHRGWWGVRFRAEA